MPVGNSVSRKMFSRACFCFLSDFMYGVQALVLHAMWNHRSFCNRMLAARSCVYPGASGRLHGFSIPAAMCWELWEMYGNFWSVGLFSRWYSGKAPLDHICLISSFTGPSVHQPLILESSGSKMDRNWGLENTASLCMPRGTACSWCGSHYR